MKILLKLIAATSLSLFACSCSSIISLSQSDLIGNSGSRINFVITERGILGLTTPTFDVNTQLADKCRGGTVTGVHTILKKRDLLILQEYELLVNASCQNAKNPQ